MKIVVSGDIHLGKRSSAIEDASSCLATKYSWEQIVDLAIRQAVDLVILTGDIIDRDNRYFEAIAPLQAGLEQLSQKGITVCMVAGNHDYDVLPEILRSTDLPHVHLLGKESKWEEFLFEKGGEKLQLIGWSFSSLYYPADPVDSLPEEMARGDMPTLAVVHGDVLTRNQKYAPMNWMALKEQPHVEGWLLGHIHKPQLLHSSPLILYPGSPHSMNPKETGVHGPFLLHLEKGKLQAEHQPLSPVRYELLEIDISDVTDKEGYRRELYTHIQSFADGLSPEYLKYVVYDILLTGEYDDLRELMQWEAEVMLYTGSHSFEEKIRKMNYDIRPRIQTEAFLHDPSYMGVLAHAILALEKKESNTFVESLRRQWEGRYQSMIQSNTFTPLLLQQTEEEWRTKRDYAILSECKRLFTELYNQNFKRQKDAD